MNSGLDPDATQKVSPVHCPVDTRVESSPETLSNLTRENSYGTRVAVAEDLFVVLDPMGAFGPPADVARIMNGSGRTDLGGQITFELGHAIGIQNTDIASDGSAPAYLKVQLVTQQVRALEEGKYAGVFNGGFSAETTPFGGCPDSEGDRPRPIEIVRYPLSMNEPVDLEGIDHVDKNEVNEAGENVFFKYLGEWAMLAAHKAVETNSVPKFVRTGHGVGAYCLPFYLQQLERLGVDTSRIVKVGQIHASGEASLELRINDALGATSLSPNKIVNVINRKVHEHANGFAYRMIAERSWADSVIIGSSRDEVNHFYGWHSFPCEGLPTMNPANAVVLKPGIHPVFYCRSHVDELQRDPGVEQLIASGKTEVAVEMIRSSLTDPDKPILFLRGRWIEDSDRKGFVAAVQALAQSAELREKINIVLFVGSDHDALYDFDRYPNSIKVNGVDKTTTMGALRAIRESEGLYEQVVACSITNQYEQAAILQWCGQQNMESGRVQYLGGSFAGHEPFGLVLTETAICGVPVVSSTGTGAKEDFLADNAIYTFDPESPEDVAKSIIQTLQAGVGLLERQVEVAEKNAWLNKGREFLEGVASKVGAIPAVGPEVFFDVTDPEVLERNLHLVEAYLIAEKYAASIFTREFVNSCLQRADSTPVAPEDIERAKQLTLKTIGVEYDDTANVYRYRRPSEA